MEASNQWSELPSRYGTRMACASLYHAAAKGVTAFPKWCRFPGLVHPMTNSSWGWYPIGCGISTGEGPYGHIWSFRGVISESFLICRSPSSSRIGEAGFL